MSLQVEGRLVDEEELVALEALAQVHLELQLALDRVLHARLEHDVAVLALPLGLVHRDVGVAQQLLGGARGRPSRCRCSRSRSGARSPSSADLERLLERFEQALGDQLGPGGERRPSAITTNSSPPRRPSASVSRTTPSRRAATARSSWSPAPWPSVSLICLKLSRSMNSAATGVWLRRARTSICSTRSRISVRFGRPVSGVVGGQEGQLLLAAVQAPRGSAGARPRRTRTSARASRRGCAAASRSASLEHRRGAARAARPPRSATSAAASRQRRQRLVTSFSGAARCAASWPKIRQDSWPTSRATSAPSPAIQRATATVETGADLDEALLDRRLQHHAPIPWCGCMPSTTASVCSLSASPRRRMPCSSSPLEGLAGVDIGKASPAGVNTLSRVTLSFAESPLD